MTSSCSPTSTVLAAGEDIDFIPLTQTTTRTTGTDEKTAWDLPCPASRKSLRTQNPIRAVVDPIVANIQHERLDGKTYISLALGDPSTNPNLLSCPAVWGAIRDAVQLQDRSTFTSTSPASTGYAPACGTIAARNAIAEYHSYPERTLHPDHVVVANGCSGALELALTALLDEETILLVPQPGFPLYQVIAESHGASVRHYHLDPNQNWQVDLNDLEQLLISHQKMVRGVVINNPSNPTGAVFTKQHLVDIITLCERHRVPIIADEIYGDITFDESRPFHPLARVVAQERSQLPVITASGLGKQFLIPGWRVGWIVFHDNAYGSLSHVEAGAKRLAQVILGASHLCQLAIPSALTDDTIPWKVGLCQSLADQAMHLCQWLSYAPGLTVIPPTGAMYAMIRINIDRFDDAINDEIEFTTVLLREENVFVLPGSCFGMKDAFRVVFCAPRDILREAACRICDFCSRHLKT